MPRRAGAGLLVLGVGNELRQDDGVGLWLARRLRAEFAGGLEVEETSELDLSLAPRLSACARLLVLDATAQAEAAPFRLLPLEAAEAIRTPRGFATHLFDWGLLLATARDLYGQAPPAELLAVAGERFGYGEGLSPACAGNAEQALVFLRGLVARAPAP